MSQPCSLHFSSISCWHRSLILPTRIDLRRRGHQIMWYTIRCNRCSSRWYSSCCFVVFICLVYSIFRQIASAGSSSLLCKRLDLFTTEVVAHSLDDLLSGE